MLKDSRPSIKNKLQILSIQMSATWDPESTFDSEHDKSENYSLSG
jgi:hypothetical protein